MQTSSSANRTCSEFSSASEYTATVLIPSSRQATITRRAISPRLAIRIFLNIERLYGEEAFAVLDRLPVLDVDLHHLPVHVGADLVHELHRFDDAEDLALPHNVTDFRKGFGIGIRGAVEGADNRRLEDCEIDLLVRRGQD